MTNSIVISADATKTIIFENISNLITVNNPSANYKNPDRDLTLGVVKNCDVVVQNGMIKEIGANIAKKYSKDKNTDIINSKKMVVMPGLIDAHTHPIFDGSRALETVLKAQGLSYEDIAARGGGIAATMTSTREADNQTLQSNFINHAQTALSRGVVCMDVKTGYGLSPKEELRHAGIIIDTVKKERNLPFVAPTYLGPHAASPDFPGLEKYICALMEIIPELYDLSKKAEKERLTLPASADIFVERNYFSPELGDLWLGNALQYGFNVHIHADEFSRSGGAELAAQLAQRREQTKTSSSKNGKVLSVDHCQYATESDLALLSTLGVCAVALPTTSFFSNIPYINGKHWQNSGIRVAIASDFNPGSSPFNNLWFAAYLALKNCGFSLAEVIAGVTHNAAYAVGAETWLGKIEVDKPANLVAFEGKQLDDFFASPLGDHVRYVVKTQEIPANY